MAKANKIAKKKQMKNAPNLVKGENKNQTASPKNSNGVEKKSMKAKQRKAKQNQNKKVKAEEKVPKAVTEEVKNEDEEVEETKQNKGMKMFKGMPKKVVPKTEEDSDDVSDSEQDSSMNSSGFSLGNEDTTIDDDDDSDEESDDDDMDRSMQLKELLGESLADDDNDASFEVDGEEEDEDESMSEDDEDDEEEHKVTPKKESKTSPKLSYDEKFTPEIRARSIFVGNVSIDTDKKELENAFKKFGPIESSRFRGAVPSDPKMPKKVAVMTKNLHPGVQTQIAFVTFEKEQSARKALTMNGEKLKNNTLRVTMMDRDVAYNEKKSIFLGNLAFEVQEDDIHKHFKECGPIESVRIVKDMHSGLCKGFGFVNFKKEDSVSAALLLNESEISGRPVRVQLNAGSPDKKSQGKRKRKNLIPISLKKKASPKKAQNEGPSPKKLKKEAGFEGQKAGQKSRKANKRGKQQKKQMAEKLMAPKKPKSE